MMNHLLKRKDPRRKGRGTNGACFSGVSGNGPLRPLPRQYLEAPGLNLLRRPKPVFGSTDGVRGVVVGLIDGDPGAAVGSTGGVLVVAVGSIGGKQGFRIQSAFAPASCFPSNLRRVLLPERFVAAVVRVPLLFASVMRLCSAQPLAWPHLR